jgi:hypothetical protein
MKTKIYLVENCYGDINKVYIGKTKNSRETKHKKTYGFQSIYTEIDSIDSLNRKDWKPLESYWIEQFRQWGFDILNVRKVGGSGPEFQTEEAKIKMRKPKVNKENFSYPKTEAFIKSVTGKPKNHPKNRNINISKSLTGYKQTEEHIKKRSAHLKNKSNIKNKKPKPKGFGDKISNLLKGKSNPHSYKPVGQYSLEGNLIQIFKSITEACDVVFRDRKRNPNITKCCQGKTKSAYGFIWRYA